jgi:hypothetical protein
MSKQKNTKAKAKGIYIPLLALVVIIGVWFLFLRDDGMGRSDAADILTGNWYRSDGAYRIEIIEVLENGKMNAAYFNPNPIHIGRSGWKVKEGELHIYVELQDENYPGSIYELRYDDTENKLSGTYYQAVAKQSYNVVFNKK